MQLVKGQTYQGTILAIAAGSNKYQDKFCRDITLQLSDGQTLKATELSTIPESQFTGMEFQKVHFVCLSPGGNGKVPWIKKDDSVAVPPAAPEAPQANGIPVAGVAIEGKSNMWLAERSARIAADMLIAGKIQMAHTESLSITDVMGSLTKQIAQMIQKVAREL